MYCLLIFFRAVKTKRTNKRINLFGPNIFQYLNLCIYLIIEMVHLCRLYGYQKEIKDLPFWQLWNKSPIKYLLRMSLVSQFNLINRATNTFSINLSTITLNPIQPFRQIVTDITALLVLKNSFVVRKFASRQAHF